MKMQFFLMGQSNLRGMETSTDSIQVRTPSISLCHRIHLSQIQQCSGRTRNEELLASDGKKDTGRGKSFSIKRVKSCISPLERAYGTRAILVPFT
jgi:hypothetical protein